MITEYGSVLVHLVLMNFFLGNFTMTGVILSINRLVVFQEGVFKDMLEQIMSIQPQIGYLNIDQSTSIRRPRLSQCYLLMSSNIINCLNFLINSDRFACGCDIAWLIRDNRHLLPVVKGGQCADDSPYPSVPFEELVPRFFTFCP